MGGSHQSKELPDRQYDPGIGGMSKRAPKVDHMGENTDVPPELYPYGLPHPPKLFAFGGTGWGYGLGCTVGPFFGIGVGYGAPGGVLFGAGTGAGAVCGVGFGSGLILGAGTAYVPIGFNFSWFYAPKYIRLERFLENVRIGQAERLSKRKHVQRAFYSLPQPLQDLAHHIFKPLTRQTPPAS
mmetsp:Transcript_8198/g.24676  ORF Transcript_8198/g.24676 Transcript_8198/m.24676 type:complete len:183 (-) Transcript_8198:197-745(-)